MTRYKLAAGVFLIATSLLSAQVFATDGRYFVVNLAGEFGKDIHAPGVKAAIADAQKIKATHLVFKLDSPGGSVRDADAIHHVLGEELGDLKVVTVVSQAFSASVWVLCNSDHIFFDGKGAAGAAVIYKMGEKGAPTAVDAKFAAAQWAKVATAAEKHGQSPAVYRAMMIQDAQLFAWDENGVTKVSGDKPPEGVENVREVDTAESVLAMTPQISQSIGFGKSLPSDGIEGLGKVLGLDSWTVAKSTSADPMRRTTPALETADKAVDASFKAIEQAVIALTRAANEAKQLKVVATLANPDRMNLAYKSGSGLLTSESQRMWRNQSERAMSAWEKYQDSLKTINAKETSLKEAIAARDRALVRQHEKRLWTGEPEKFAGKTTIDLGFDKETEWKTAQKSIQDLQERINRNRIDDR